MDWTFELAYLPTPPSNQSSQPPNGLPTPQPLLDNPPPLPRLHGPLSLPPTRRLKLSLSPRLSILPRLRTLIQQPRRDGETVDIEILADLAGDEEGPVGVGEEGEEEVRAEVP